MKIFQENIHNSSMCETLCFHDDVSPHSAGETLEHDKNEWQKKISHEDENICGKSHELESSWISLEKNQ